MSENRIIYPDYEKCLTNVACTILKHFGLAYAHPSLDVLDRALAEKEYKNIVLLIYDGMGLNILNGNLPDDSFLRRHRIDTLTSVFPSTTAAATTSLRSGLNPVESGWTGWDVYIKPVDEIVTVFRNQIKDTETQISTENVAQKYLHYREITTQINEDTPYKAYTLMPFGDDPYHGLPDMNKRVIDLCRQDGKKFLHVYCTEPDSSLHNHGTQHPVIQPLLETLDRSTKELIAGLEDTLVICLADHGHIDVENINLSRDYPDLVELLAKDNVSGDDRACIFWVKEADKPLFEQKFQQYFAKDFMLLSKDEAIARQLFGTGPQHENFEASIGDYVAIGIGNKYFDHHFYERIMYSHHAGLTEQEMIVPLILFKT